MDGSLDHLVNISPEEVEIGRVLASGAYSFVINCLSSGYMERRARIKDGKLKRLKYEALPESRDIERGVRKAQLRATCQVVKYAAKLEPQHENYFEDVAKRLKSEIEEVDQNSYTFANMPHLNEAEYKKLLLNISINEEELGWQLERSTLAELKQRFGSDPAFGTLQRLLLAGWEDSESSFDWFNAFSSYFAEERRNNSSLREAFDGHVLTEIANRLETVSQDIQDKIDKSSEVLIRSRREDGALIHEKLDDISKKLDLLLERSEPRAWSLPDLALTPDASHLPLTDASFIFPLSLGVEVAGAPIEGDEHRIPYEASSYSENRDVYRGRRRAPKPAAQLLNEWLRQPGLHVVTGEPGGGKTTLLSHWAKTLHQAYLDDDIRPFPLYLPLRQMRDVNREILRDKGVQSYFESQGLWNYVIDVTPYRSGERKAVWLLDGWDELGSSQQREDWQTIISALEGVVIISCRVAQYRNEFRRDHLIMGLSKPEQAEFLEMLTPSLQGRDAHAYRDANERWRAELVREVNEHPRLRQLATNPLLLNLIARTNPPGSVQLPNDRAGFYQQALDEMLERRLPDLGVVQKHRLEQALVNIAELAKLDLSISGEVLVSALTELGSPDNIEAQLKSSGILRPKGRGYEYLHATFQEWSLARALRQKSDLLEAVKTHWRQPRYEETLALLWSMATPEQRLAATKFLIEVGCQAWLDESGEEQNNRKRSGIRTALHLWHRSGLTVEPESLEKLLHVVRVGRFGENLRAVAVAWDDGTPADVLASLSGIEDANVRGGVARNPNTGKEVLLKLVRIGDSPVRIGVANNPRTPEPILLELIKIEDRNPYVRKGATRNPNVAEATLVTLLDNEDFYLCLGLTLNPNTPESLLLELVDSAEPALRRSAVRNSNVKEAALQKLVEHDDPYIRGGVARNPNATEAMLLKLVTDKDSGVRWIVAGNPNLSSEVLSELAKDEHAGVRGGVAGNPNTTHAVLLELAEDDVLSVQADVARNPNTDEATLLELVKNKGPAVLSGLINYKGVITLSTLSNPNVTEAVLRVLMGGEDSIMRGSVANAMNVTEDMLLELLEDANPNAPVGVAKNPASCIEWL